jgi:hypothetical protein
LTLVFRHCIDFWTTRHVYDEIESAASYDKELDAASLCKVANMHSNAGMPDAPRMIVMLCHIITSVFSMPCIDLKLQAIVKASIKRMPFR